MVSRLVLVVGAAFSLGVQTWGASGDTNLSFSLEAEFSYQYNTSDNSIAALVGQIDPQLEVDFSTVVAGRLSGRIRLDQEDRFLPGRPEFENYEAISRPYAFNRGGVAELRDAYIDLRVPIGKLRLGKQQIVWGSLDGLKVLDVLNPQSFEEFILDDFEDSRIGLWSAYADLSLLDWRFEFAYIPDTTTHYLPENGAYFALSAPRFQFGITQPSSVVAQSFVGSDDEDGTFAARLSRYLGGVDFQVVVVSGLDPEPLGRFADGGSLPTLELFHERRSLYGLALEGSRGRLVMRAELSYSPDRLFNQRVSGELASIKADQWRGAIGVDFSAPWGVFMNLQYLRDQLSSTPTDIVRPTTDEILTVFLRKRFAYDTVTIDARWYNSLREGDDLLRLEFSYQFSDRGTIEAAVDQFYGTERGIFGQFRDRDRVSLTLKYAF